MLITMFLKFCFKTTTEILHQKFHRKLDKKFDYALISSSKLYNLILNVKQMTA